MYLLITKSGGKHWKLKYYFDDKEKKLSLGAYPEISLLYVRGLREKYKSEIAKGINPSEVKQLKKATIKIEDSKKNNTFKKVALERLAFAIDKTNKNKISESH